MTSEDGPCVSTCRLQVDGAARGNPGPAAAAAVLLDADGRELWSKARPLGETTNNVAEYEALIMGLERARDSCSRLVVAMDSELVVKQLCSVYKVRQDHLRPLFERAKALMDGFAEIEVVHVRREENARADELANDVLDRMATPETFEVREAGQASQARQAARGGQWRLTVKSHFDAAHALMGYPGKCRELHGHTWDVEATVAGETLDDIGILFDFTELKALLGRVLAPLDHTHLNEVPPFDELSPTGEHLARHIYEELARRLPAGVDLVEVVVWESPVARLSYRR